MQLLRNRKIIVLIIGVLVWLFFSRQPELTERYYSNGVYPFIAVVQRVLTGWLPVSVGDILYAFAIGWLVYKIFLFFRDKKYRSGFYKHLIYVSTSLLSVWVVFQLVWGLNYYRLGLGDQTKLIPAPYNTDTLAILTRQLIDAANTERSAMGSSFEFPGWDSMQQRCISAYDSAKKQYPFFHYRVQSVKQTLYGRLGNYIGFLGYYNPFSGEAQLNRFIPEAVKPFTICHEIAHQVGYASESEASFAAYLICMESNDLMLQYSAHFDVLLYAWSELYYRDSSTANTLMKSVDTTVKADWQAYRDYVNAHKNPIEPVMNSLYSFFLKANNQDAGIESYDEVVAWVNAYEYRKQKNETHF